VKLFGGTGITEKLKIFHALWKTTSSRMDGENAGTDEQKWGSRSEDEEKKKSLLENS